MKRLLPLVFLTGCSSLGDFGAGAKMANTIANGVACGMAAANGTPCTPQAVLDALARDAAAQREKVQAVAPQAAATDPALTERLLAQLEANTESNRAVTKALLDLATRTSAPVESPPTDAGAPDAADGAP
jgi:signal transduction protein with GAF and PtsI domain